MKIGIATCSVSLSERLLQAIDVTTMIHVIAREGQRVALPAPFNSNDVSMRLLRLSKSSPFRIFRLKNGQIYAAECVGSLGLGSLRVDILPKSTASDDVNDSDFLLNIMRFAGYISRVYTIGGMVRRTTLDPAEAVITEVASEIVRSLREGVPRRYEEQSDESATIRGRIDFTKLSTRLPSVRSRLPIRYAPLTQDNQLSRVIKWVSSRLFTITRAAHNREALGRALSQLGQIDAKNVLAQEIKSLDLSRYEGKWERTIEVANLLAQGNAPDPTSSGDHHAFSMIFPLQHLFERSMRKILQAATHPYLVDVNHHTEALYLLECTTTGKKAARLRPDYVFRVKGKPIAIADAKWKRLSEARRGHNIAVDDLYQMNAYLTRYQVKTAILLYPQANWMPESWTHSYRIPGTDKLIHVVGVDIENLVSRDKEKQIWAQNTLGIILNELIPAR